MIHTHTPTHTPTHYSAVHIHSSLTHSLTHSLTRYARSFVHSFIRSFVASPVNSYGGGAGVVFSCIRRYYAAKQRGSELRNAALPRGATENRASECV